MFSSTPQSKGIRELFLEGVTLLELSITEDSDWITKV